PTAEKPLRLKPSPGRMEISSADKLARATLASRRSSRQLTKSSDSLSRSPSVDPSVRLALGAIASKKGTRKSDTSVESVKSPRVTRSMGPAELNQSFESTASTRKTRSALRRSRTPDQEAQSGAETASEKLTPKSKARKRLTRRRSKTPEITEQLG